ncbi:sodium:phosphate symporter [Xylanimonas ulmi]
MAEPADEDKPGLDQAALGAVRLATLDTPPWVRALGWVGVIALIYLLITAVSVIGRGFSGLSGDAAQSLFAFAANPWVGLFVGVLSTVLIQSSTTTTAITVTAVGAGALPLASAVPILFGANVGTTLTSTLIALGYIGNRREYRRALEASSIHDFYNWLALLVFFPIELAFQPLQRLSGALADVLYGTSLMPDPAGFNLVRTITRPVVNVITGATANLDALLGPLVAIVIGASMIFAAVKLLGKLLKRLMVGRARDLLTRAAGRNSTVGVVTGTGVTFVTQSSTVTTSILIPFAAGGFLTSKQLYPITVGANIGTTFTTVLAAFAVIGQDARIGLQAAFVHLLFNLLSLLVIYVIPLLRPVPLRCAEALARVASARTWVIGVYVAACYVVIPALVILLVGVL